MAFMILRIDKSVLRCGKIDIRNWKDTEKGQFLQEYLNNCDVPKNLAQAILNSMPYYCKARYWAFDECCNIEVWQHSAVNLAYRNLEWEPVRKRINALMVTQAVEDEPVEEKQAEEQYNPHDPSDIDFDSMRAYFKAEDVKDYIEIEYGEEALQKFLHVMKHKRSVK